jgi:HPt (histidine-containing phosphotransfer) domain-containing protein
MINLEYLKKTTENDTEIIHSLLDMFKAQVPKLKSEMTNALNEKNWYALKEAAHKAKNSFLILGMEKEADSLQELEKLCSQEKDTHLYADYVQQFIIACDDSVKEIEKGF